MQELKTALQEISANFIQMKSDLYTSIARLTVSEGLKEQLRNDVFGESTLKKGYVFARAEQAVDQVNVSSLIRVLQEGNNLSDADVTGMDLPASVPTAMLLPCQRHAKFLLIKIPKLWNS